MRTLFTLTAIAILILAAGTATAERYREDSNSQAMYTPENYVPDTHGITVLKISPQYLEIHQVNEAALEMEGKLLALLASAQEDDVVQQLVYRLERLNTDREIDILKIRIRYARLGGQFDLAMELRHEMLELIRQDLGQPM